MTRTSPGRVTYFWMTDPLPSSSASGLSPLPVKLYLTPLVVLPFSLCSRVVMRLCFQGQSLDVIIYCFINILCTLIIDFKGLYSYSKFPLECLYLRLYCMLVGRHSCYFTCSQTIMGLYVYIHHTSHHDHNRMSTNFHYCNRQALQPSETPSTDLAIYSRIFTILY